MINLLMWAIPVGSSIWVGFDAKRHQIPVNKKPYSFNNGAFAWVLSCVALWIFLFPTYLYKRAKALRSKGETKSSSGVVTVFGLGLVAAEIVLVLTAI